MSSSIMTSRQRILMALHHQRPDRMPVDFGGMRSAGISTIACHRLKKHLGIKERAIQTQDENVYPLGDGGRENQCPLPLRTTFSHWLRLSV